MKYLVCLLFLPIFFTGFSQKEKVYFLPGQGADGRLFSQIEIDTSIFDTVHITYPEIQKKETMKGFAQRILIKIDTSKSFHLIGTSFGGMLACEIAEICTPKSLILISSAKNKKELPFRYRFQKAFPIYRVLPGNILLWGAKFLQPLVEPDSKNYRQTFESMLGQKSAFYMKWSIHMICQWEKESYPTNYLHLHGEKDKTIPIRNIQNAKEIKGGSHMMTLTLGAQLSPFIMNELLHHSSN